MIGQLIQHPDGKWWTSESSYKEFKLIIKMRENSGSKIHISKDGKVIKTFRYHFATVDFLIEKAKKWIDKEALTAAKL